MKRRELLKGSIALSAGMAVGYVTPSGGQPPSPLPKAIVWKSPEKYSPLAYFDRMYAETTPRLAFRASSPDEAVAWKKKLRLKLWELLAERHEPGRSEPAGRSLETMRLDGYIREKREIDVVPGRTMPFYILTPEGERKPYKTVLCLHGHGNGVRDVVGLASNDTERAHIRSYNYDYAVQCARRGWCAIAPELFAFGERVDSMKGAPIGCEKPFLNALLLGKTLAGIRTKDVCTLIDWLSFQDVYDMSSLACMGLSGGGTITMYASALEDRIHRVMPAGILAEVKPLLFDMLQCPCNYIPGMFHWTDLSDVAGLIAPRFMVVQCGRNDPIIPIDSSRSAMEKLRRIYAVYGKPENLLYHEHDGAHVFWSKSLDDFLV